MPDSLSLFDAPSGLYQYDMLEQRIRSVSTEVMEKEVIKQLKVRDWTMPKISISRQEQEELLLAAWIGHEHNGSDNSVTRVGRKSAYTQFVREGSLQSRLGELQLSHFAAKAQTFQSLTELMYNHIQTTYRAMIGTDKLLAADIVIAALVDPTIDPETKQALEQDPQQAFEPLLKKISKKAKLSQIIRAPKSEDAILCSGRTNKGGAWWQSIIQIKVTLKRFDNTRLGRE